MYTIDEILEKYRPIIFYTNMIAYKYKQYSILKRERNYNAYYDPEKNRIYVKHIGKWIPNNELISLLTIPYNEKCIVLDSVFTSGLQRFDVVTCTSGLTYDKDYGGFYGVVKRWSDDEDGIIISAEYLRPVSSFL